MGLWRATTALIAVMVCAPALAQLRANDPASWVVSSDGPFDPIGPSRTVARLGLKISADGRVVDCKPEYVQPAAKVPEKVCTKLRERARYRVAADTNGKPKAVADILTYALNRDAIVLLNDFGGAKPIKPETWITNGNYPVEALRQRAQGRVTFAFDITPDGKAAACRVVSSSGYPILDEATCLLIQRNARFVAPADEQGRPTATRGFASFVWAIQ